MGARRGRRRDMGIAAVATGSNAGSKERQTNDGRRLERRRRREAEEQKITRRRRIASVRKDGGPAGSGRQHFDRHAFGNNNNASHHPPYGKRPLTPLRALSSLPRTTTGPPARTSRHMSLACTSISQMTWVCNPFSLCLSPSLSLGFNVKVVLPSSQKSWIGMHLCPLEAPASHPLSQGKPSTSRRS